VQRGISLSIAIVHIAGIAKGFGWENDLSLPLRYRHYQSSSKEQQVMIL